MNGSDNQQGKVPEDTPNACSKRSRTVSVSGRLRSASLLCNSGKISDEDKDSMKDLILTQDPLVEQAFIEFEDGDERKLLDLVKSGYLKKNTEFSFLDSLGDFGLGGLSLNPFPGENIDNSSMFGFGSNFDMDHGIPDDLDLEGYESVRLDNSKRSRDSIDYQEGPPSLSLEDQQDRRRMTDHLSGFSFNQPEDDANTPNDFVNYRHVSFIHPDGMDFGHYDTDPLGYSAQDNSLMTSSYIVDTSTLTLSENIHSDEKRLPPPGLTPINTQAESQKKFIGIYSPESRKKRVERFFEKRKQRVWTKKVKYDVRKNFADSRLRVKGRFVKKEDEELLRELMNLT